MCVYSIWAAEITEWILDICDRQSDSIYERYDSKTGQGLGAKNFGWSAVFIQELILLKYRANVI